MDKLVAKFLELLKSLGIEVGDKEKDLNAKLTDAIKDALKDQSTDETLKAELAKMQTQLDELKKLPDDKTGAIAQLNDLVKGMSATITELKKDRDNQQKAVEDKLKADREKKVAELKKKGIDEGKITEAKWNEKWKAEAEADPDKFEKILEDLAVDPHFKKSAEQGAETPGNNGYVGPLMGADRDILKSMQEMNAN
jgi:predicted  nucleic acid-binding Zn-ribbon protein